MVSHREPFYPLYYLTYTQQTYPPHKHQDIKLITFADDISITIQNPSIPTATTLTQSYVQQLETWLKSNRMTAFPEKSSITLNTIDRHQSSLHLHVKLNKTLIPLNKFSKILGLTYDTHFTF